MSFPVPAAAPGDVPGDAPLLDVREDQEWAAGHAEGALHVPMGQVIERLDEITAHAAGSTLYVLCRVGGRSAQVTAYLTRQGVDAVNVEGGMEAWRAAGKPMVGEHGAEPFVL
jgi:rhodanese-related sulfurtransferase